jgi:hypothetical protein
VVVHDKASTAATPASEVASSSRSSGGKVQD